MGNTLNCADSIDDRLAMSLTDHTSTRSTWTMRVIGWTIALLIIVPLAYKTLFRQQAEQKAQCLDQAASSQRATNPTTTVNKYAACELGNAKAAGMPPAATGTADAVGTASTTSGGPVAVARCRYTGVWSAARGNMEYLVTLEADGRFVAEPSQNVPPNAAIITGAWSVAGNKMAWAYDEGPVWPPDVNPISADSGDAFTLSEVNGATTRYTLVERSPGTPCN